MNLDDASRGATSRNLRVDLREGPVVGLGVRSFTRRVRDDCGAAGGDTLDDISESPFCKKIYAYQKQSGLSPLSVSDVESLEWRGSKTFRVRSSYGGVLTGKYHVMNG